ncbi:uncharacterized protein PHA67_020506 [Liasis olivaceus]
MKNQKMPKAIAAAHRKRLQGVTFATKLSPGTHRAAETPDLHKCKSVRLGSHTLKPELASLIEKTLQEAEISGTQEATLSTEEDLRCLKVIKKKVSEITRDKEISHEQAASARVDSSKQTKDLSSFVEIDLRDRIEEKTEDILAEDKQHEKEEEPPQTMSQSSWLCCFPLWMKQKKKREKQE